MPAKRTHLLRITLTEEEKAEAKATAASLGVSLASLARMGLFRAIRTWKEGEAGKKKPTTTT